MPYVWQIPKFVRSYLRYVWQSCFEKPDLEGVFSPPKSGFLIWICQI